MILNNSFASHLQVIPVMPNSVFRLVCTLAFILVFKTSFSQVDDSSKTIQLHEVIVNDNQSFSVERMPELKGNVIYAGKKNEVVLMKNLNADLSTNNTRQVFAKVPGLTIWENDGSGIQVGVAARGLSPNRSWEFNVRQNGYDISPDVFGYPESYYTPPMEALERIEVVRGAASLQYGPQFGGLLNYQISKGNQSKPFSFETQQTFGSFGMFNSFNSISGKINKFSYHGFLQFRRADGWRENSEYKTYTGHLSASYQLTKKLLIEAEYTNMNYESQQPGGLTDAQYEIDHQKSTRERNWFSAPWNVALLKLSYAISPLANIQLKAFTNISERNSVGYTKSINTPDSIDSTTQQFSNRQVDRDDYQNLGIEVRTSFKHKLHNLSSTFAGGFRLYTGKTVRNQLGIGTTGSDFDLTLTNPVYGRSLNYETNNIAFFAEEMIQINKRFKIIPGIRYEYIDNNVEGYINTTTNGTLPSQESTRNFLLYGIGSELQLSKETNLYTNYSLSYRPVTFSELTPSATNEIIDPNLKDANGYNIDLGYRGKLKEYLTFDIGVFYLRYNDRIGTLSQNGTPYKTNVGNSVSKGIESFVEFNPFKIKANDVNRFNIGIFASNSFINATYVEWKNPAIANDPTKSIENKDVENAPTYIHRFGMTFYYKEFSLSSQFNMVSSVFTDAANSNAANSTATIGKLNGYEVLDLTLSGKFLKNYTFKAGLNNILDEKYATRRSTGYPGPGILPGNGRTFFATVGASF